MGDSTNVFNPETGSGVFLGPVGTTAPTTSATALNASFVDVGYVSDDIPSFGISTDSSEIRDWLGDLVKTLETSRTETISLPLLETTPEALKLAFQGGTITGVGPGEAKFVPGTSTQERAMVIDMVEGTKRFRLHIPRASVSEVGETSFSPEDGTIWQITFTVLTPDSGDRFEIFTNLPSIVAASA